MKRVKKIVFVILSILLGLILLFSIYNFVSIKILHKDLASINGYAILEVVSGSMEPTIHKGDMIIINTKEKNYKENDIITFRGKENEFVTHRIISIDKDMMITKGDNNNTEDDAIKTSSIVGKYVAKITGGGRIISSFKNPFTLAMIFIIGLLACILLSTDSDGKPILEKEEKEFQEFLKSKNEVKKLEEKEIKDKKTSKKKEVADTVKKEVKGKTSSSKKKANTNSSDTKKVTSKKTTTKETTPKVSTTKKSATKPVVKVENKKVATKNSEPKKAASKNETAKKVVTKKTSTAKTSATKSTKKTTATKNNKK